MFYKFLSYHGNDRNTVKPHNSRTTSARANPIVPIGSLYPISIQW